MLSLLLLFLRACPHRIKCLWRFFLKACQRWPHLEHSQEKTFHLKSPPTVTSWGWNFNLIIPTLEKASISATPVRIFLRLTCFSLLISLCVHLMNSFTLKSTATGYYHRITTLGCSIQWMLHLFCKLSTTLHSIPYKKRNMGMNSILILNLLQLQNPFIAPLQSK